MISATTKRVGFVVKRIQTGCGQCASERRNPIRDRFYCERMVGTGKNNVFSDNVGDENRREMEKHRGRV